MAHLPHTSLRYCGPSLDHLDPGQLPKHFEAEARSRPPAPEEGGEAEVLQLVSGRTLLGAVSLLAPGTQLGSLPEGRRHWRLV